MFDLDQEILAWRQSVQKQLPSEGETVDELETHLRDAVERLMAAGASPQQAWETALAQLGSSEQLSAEFGKLPGTSPLRWLPAKVLLAVHACFAVWLGFVVARLAGRRDDVLLAVHVFAVTVGYSSVFAVGMITAWSIAARAMRGWTEREQGLLRSAIRWWTAGGLTLTVLGVVLGAVWAQLQWGRFWSWHPQELAALGVLAWNVMVLGMLAWRPRGQRLAMLLGLLGSLVVAACWFGPEVMRWGLHSYT